jgi:acetyl esterase/lipase
MFEPQSAPDIERAELTIERGGVALSVLRPVGSADEPPVLYWMHGDGMVIGNRHMDDARLIEWCRWLGCVCVSVEYRLAPEAPYPTPLDDCEAGLRFIVEHVHDLRIDP